jgi:hypothetical protein
VSAKDYWIQPYRPSHHPTIPPSYQAIVRANFTLVDPFTGQPTTWGQWQPERINGDRDFSDQNGLNSLQIVAWLQAVLGMTEHVALRAEFEGALEYLYAQGYNTNLLNAKVNYRGLGQEPVTSKPARATPRTTRTTGRTSHTAYLAPITGHDTR